MTGSLFGNIQMVRNTKIIISKCYASPATEFGTFHMNALSTAKIRELLLKLL